MRLLVAGIGVVAGVAVAAGIAWWCSNGFLAGDTLTYWLAGTRINVGHDLYSVRPDDPFVFDIRPYGLYSPPLIAVPWIVLAAMPGATGMVAWWLLMAGLGIWAIAVLLLGTRGLAGLLVLPLVPSITLLIGVGNVDAAMLAGVVGTWMLTTAGKDRWAGVLVGLLVSVKLTPAVLLVWLLSTRRWGALAAAATTAAVLAAATAVVLGPGIFLDYFRVVVGASSSGRTWALLAIPVGLAAVMLLGSRHGGVAFALSMTLVPLGSPVAAVHTWALLVACAAPLLPGARSNGRTQGFR